MTTKYLRLLRERADSMNDEPTLADLNDALDHLDDDALDHLDDARYDDAVDDEPLPPC